MNGITRAEAALTGQVVIVLTRYQSEYIRALLYEQRGLENDKVQLDFLETLLDQFEQCEDGG